MLHLASNIFHDNIDLMQTFGNAVRNKHFSKLEEKKFKSVKVNFIEMLIIIEYCTQKFKRNKKEKSTKIN